MCDEDKGSRVGRLLGEKKGLVADREKVYGEKIAEHEAFLESSLGQLAKMKNLVLGQIDLDIKKIDQEMDQYRSILVRNLPSKEFSPDMFSSLGKVVAMYVKGWEWDMITVFVEFMEPVVLSGKFPGSYGSLAEFDQIKIFAPKDDLSRLPMWQRKESSTRAYINWKERNGTYSFGVIKN